MTGFEWPKWDEVFVPDGSLLESFLRGTLVYFALVVLFRIILRRQRGGSVGLGDLMLLVLISVVQSYPLQVVRDGRPIPENMRKERLRDDELAAELRKQGVDDLSRVRAAFVEAEGDTSIIQAEGGRSAAGEPSGEWAADPSHPPDFDAALRHFLEAARRLHQAANWHDEQAAEHRRLAAEARTALSRHGVRPKALLEADGDHPAEANGRHDGPPTEPG
jgi:uncharacterized membrane protein YcaP (DUF421 family)